MYPRTRLVGKIVKNGEPVDTRIMRIGECIELVDSEGKRIGYLCKVGQGLIKFTSKIE